MLAEKYDAAVQVESLKERQKAAKSMVKTDFLLYSSCWLL